VWEEYDYPKVVGIAGRRASDADSHKGRFSGRSLASPRVHRMGFEHVCEGFSSPILLNLKPGRISNPPQVYSHQIWSSIEYVCQNYQLFQPRICLVFDA
jgi:hypothetical protein